MWWQQRGGPSRCLAGKQGNALVSPETQPLTWGPRIAAPPSTPENWQSPYKVVLGGRSRDPQGLGQLGISRGPAQLRGSSRTLGGGSGKWRWEGECVTQSPVARILGSARPAVLGSLNPEEDGREGVGPRCLDVQSGSRARG